MHSDPIFISDSDTRASDRPTDFNSMPPELFGDGAAPSHERHGERLGVSVGHILSGPHGQRELNRPNLGEATSGSGGRAPVPVHDEIPEVPAEDVDVKLADCESGRLMIGLATVTRLSTRDVFG